MPPSSKFFGDTDTLTRDHPRMDELLDALRKLDEAVDESRKLRDKVGASALATLTEEDITNTPLTTESAKEKLDERS